MRRKPTSKIPRHYIAQVQILLEITDLEEADFVQFVPGDQEVFIVTRVKRDREWFKEKRVILESFITVLRDLQVTFMDVWLTPQNDSESSSQKRPEVIAMLKEDKLPYRFARYALGMDVEYLEPCVYPDTEYVEMLQKTASSRQYDMPVFENDIIVVP